MPQDDTLFQILEGRSRQGRALKGFFPLNENHWSNVLAWLLADDSPVARSLLALLAPGFDPGDAWRVDREVVYVVGERRRLIDVQVASSAGRRLFIEVKIDPNYIDREQLVDQLGLLQPDEHFAFVAPLDLSYLFAEATRAGGSAPAHRAVAWKSLARWCSEQAARDDLTPVLRVVLAGLAAYEQRAVTTPFEQMTQTLIEEQGWTTFYPDDFKAAFVQRFPEVWAEWLAARPATGNGNAHQYLVTCLSMLANRKQGFRLVRTGEKRRPVPADWGYPVIYELKVWRAGDADDPVTDMTPLDPPSVE